MSVQQWNDDTLVVVLEDDPELSEDFTDITVRLRETPCDVVLDLSSLTLITSSGIAKLLRLRKHEIECKRRLLLTSPQDRVWGVLLATGLESIFEFAETVSEALVRLESGKPQ